MSIPRPYRDLSPGRLSPRSSSSCASFRVQPFGGRALSPLPRVASLSPREPLPERFTSRKQTPFQPFEGKLRRDRSAPSGPLPPFCPATFRELSLPDEKKIIARRGFSERTKYDGTSSTASFFSTARISRHGPIWREPAREIESASRPVWSTRSGGRLAGGELPLRRAYVPDEQSHLVLDANLFTLKTGEGTPFQGRF